MKILGLYRSNNMIIISFIGVFIQLDLPENYAIIGVFALNRL